MIKRFFKNRVVLNTIILTIFTYSTELIVRIFTGAPFKDFSIVRIFLSSLILSMFVSFLGHFLPKLGQRIVNIIYVLFIGLLEFFEFGLSSYIGFFMGIGNAEQGTKISEFIKDFFNSYKLVHWTILIPLVLFLVYFIVFDRLVHKNTTRNEKMTMLQKVYIEIVTVVIIVLLGGAYYYTVRSKEFQNKLQVESNYSLWLYPVNSNLTVNNYGVAVYVFCDIRANILGIDSEYVMKIEEQIYESENKNENNDNTPVDYTRTIDDTAWEKLIANTKDSTFKTLNNYFINRNITQKNDMTGIFEGKNLIIIMMESTNEISILNKDYFPTLYKMYHEGISFQNNFSPRNNCSTGNNEFTALSSLFTINNTCTANAYRSNKYFEGVFNVFNNAGYKTSAYHDYTQKFYMRSKSLPNLGANKYYGVEALGIPYSTTYTEADDKDMFMAAQQYYMNEDQFMAYFATVTPHQSYIASQTCSDRYFDKYRKLGYSANLSRYLSKMQVMDEAFAELLKELEDSGKLKDTVIAIFGDHFPYGLADSQINEFLKANNAEYTISRNSTTNKNVDRTPMIIYNSEIEPLEVKDYTTIIDLLPTLLNMFNLEYDPRLYLGTDVFSESHASRAVFADGSWADERGYYHAPNSKMTYLEGAEHYSTDELVYINQEISKRQKMSESAIRSNYFKYLGEGLEKYKVKEETTEKTEVQE
ncbi:MAG: sulfatase-like hydrolase/transferase [Erysipelotrichales bacterium]|nr:sulfatase-like hydrolase/transferase [Erysipelotrichales bacterium]